MGLTQLHYDLRAAKYSPRAAVCDLFVFNEPLGLPVEFYLELTGELKRNADLIHVM